MSKNTKVSDAFWQEWESSGELERLKLVRKLLTETELMDIIHSDIPRKSKEHTIITLFNSYLVDLYDYVISEHDVPKKEFA